MQKFLTEDIKIFVKEIIIKEKIQIEEDVIDFIIKISNNSLNTILHILEKFYLLNETITLNKANQLCLTINFQICEEYFNLIFENKMQKAIEYINGIYDLGYSIIDILDSLYIYIKYSSKINDENKYDIILIICKYIIINTNIHEDNIELAFLTNKLCECVNKSTNKK